MSTAAGVVLIALLSGVAAMPAATPVGAQTSDSLCDPGGVVQFSDVSEGDYAAAYIHCVRALELSRGRGDGTFGPDDTLTRAQMAAFLIRLWRDVLDQECPTGSEPFTDVDDDHWAAADIACLYNLGVTKGATATTYQPGAHITGSQITRFVTRLLNRRTAGFCDTSGNELARAAECLTARNVAPSGAEAKSSRAVTRAQMSVYLIGAWYHATERGQPPEPPARPRAVTTTTMPSSGETSCEFTDHAIRVSKAVYQVRTGEGIGTAFYIGDDEWLTAAHVVGSQTSVTLHRDGTTITAEIVSSDAGADLALLRASVDGIAPLRFGSVSGVIPGQELFAVGYPVMLASQPSVTRGVLSRLETDPALGDLILTDAAINPGNSGGPLLDECGKVVALVVAKFVREDVEGISYAVAESTLRQRLPDLRTGRPLPQPPDNAGTGQWEYFDGAGVDGAYEGHWLAAVDGSGTPGEFSSTLIVRCGISTPGYDSVFIIVMNRLILGDADSEVIVDYRFSNMESPVSEWWWSSEDIDSAIFAEEATTEFAARMRSAATGSLWVRIQDWINGEIYSIRFEIDGAVAVLDDLDCW